MRSRRPRASSTAGARRQARRRQRASSTSSFRLPRSMCWPVSGRYGWVNERSNAPSRCAGVVATACTQGKRTQHGRPQGVVRDDQPDAREGEAGRPGESERFIVPMKPGNAGGGTGPQFKTNAIRREGPGDWVTYQLRKVFRNCRRRCTRKRRQKPAIVSTPCTTRSAVMTSWRMLSGKRLTDRTPSEECSYRKPMANSGRWASRCALHNAPCSIRVEGWDGDTGRVGNPLPQSVICRVGDGDDVWQAKLPLLCCYEAPVDPVINHPHTDAVSFANLFDVERIGGKRRAGNVMLVADPADHADREAPSSRAFEAVAVEERDDLIVIVRGCQGTDVSNERIGITNRFGAVRRQA